MSPQLSDRSLLAWLAGALEPGEAHAVAAEVAASHELQARVDGLRRQLRPRERKRTWRIPPPGVQGGRRGFAVEHRLAAVMGDALRPGDRFQVVIGPMEDAAARRLVVLTLENDAWRVVFPTRSAEDVTLDLLPAAADGSRSLDLTAGAAPGRQRWAVALPLAASPIDWALLPDERWASVRAQIVAGEVPVTAVEIEVEAAP